MRINGKSLAVSLLRMNLQLIDFYSEVGYGSQKSKTKRLLF